MSYAVFVVDGRAAVDHSFDLDVEDGVDILCQTGGVKPLDQAAALASAEMSVGPTGTGESAMGPLSSTVSRRRMNPIIQRTRRYYADMTDTNELLQHMPALTPLERRPPDAPSTPG